MDDRQHHYLLRELYYKGMDRSAVALLPKALAQKGWAPEQVMSLYYASICAWRLGDVKNAEGMLLSAIGLDQNMREPWLQLAHMKHRQRNFKAARAYYKAALECKSHGYYFEYADDYKPNPRGLDEVL